MSTWKKIGCGCLGFAAMAGMLIVQTLAMIGICLAYVFWMIATGSEKGAGAAVFAAAIFQLMDEQYLTVLLVTQLATLLIFGLWYALVFIRRQPKKDMRPVFGLRSLCSFLLLGMGGYLLVAVGLEAAELLVPQQMEAYRLLMEQSGIGELSVLSSIVTLIMAPFGEEIIFRGLALGYFKRAGMAFWIANIIQALCFGIAHFNWVQGCYAFFLGLALGWLGRRFQTLAAPALLHLFFNFSGTYLAAALDGMPGEQNVLTAATAAAAVLLLGSGMRLLQRVRVS